MYMFDLTNERWK